MKQQTTIILLIVGIALLLFANLVQYTNKIAIQKEHDALVTALEDTLTLVRNEDSTLKASIAVIQTQSTKDFISLQTKDKEISELQGLVKKYRKELGAGSSVTKGEIYTEADLSKDTAPAIVKVDTVHKDSFIYVYPTYKDSVYNQWIKVVGTMSKDSSNFKVAVSNKFSVVVGEHRFGFLGQKRQAFVDLNLENPYSTAKQLRSYQVSVPPPKKWGIGVTAAYGVNSQLKRDFFLGFGITYDFLRF